MVALISTDIIKEQGKYRQVPYMEGWFQMFRTDLSFHLDLDVNRLGWGTDLYLSKRSRDKGLMNIVDDAITVHHPKETGFDNNEGHESDALMGGYIA